MKDFDNRYPCFAPMVGMALGIVASYYGLGMSWGWLPLSLGLLFLILYYILGRKLVWYRRFRPWLPVGIGMMMAGVGVFDDNRCKPEDIDFEYGKVPYYVTATVENVRDLASGQQLTVSIDSLSNAGLPPVLMHFRDEKENIPVSHVKARLMCDDSSLRPYDRIRFVNALRRIEDSGNYQNSGYYEYLTNHNILWSQQLTEGNYRVLAPADGFRRWCEDRRIAAAVVIEKSGLKRSTQAFLETLLLGLNDTMSGEEREAFADAGISHVLAVSGLHMGVIAALIGLLTAPLLLIRGFKWRYGLTIILLWVYVCLSGLHLSALRAAVMITLLLGASIVGRRNSVLNSLCVAVLLIMLFDPRSVLDVGMQLSVVCVASLAAFAEISSVPKAIWHKPVLNRLWQITAVSLVAVAGSWAVTAYYFHTLSLMFLPMNLLIVPLLPIYLACGLLHLGLSALSLPAEWLVRVLDGGYELLLAGCRHLSGAGSIELWVSWLTPLLWLAGLAVMWLAVRDKSRRTGIAGAALLLCSVATIPLFPDRKPRPGVIVRTDRQEVVIAQYDPEGREEVGRYSIYHNAMVKAGGKRIVITGNDSLSRIPAGCDIMVVTAKPTESLRQLCERYSPRMVALHPSMYREDLTDIYSEALLSKLHCTDMSEDGPLRLLEE